jgi:hypothetical protein
VPREALMVEGLLALTGKGRAMNAKWLIGLMVLLAGNGIAVADYPETRVYLLGDKDDFHYDGLGSDDHVYVDPDVVAFNSDPTWPIIPFDTFRADSILPFTFTYHLLGDEQIVAATLTVAMRASDQLASTDRIFLLSPDASYYVDWYFDVIGWLPIGSTGTTIRSLEPGAIQGTNYLWLLQDGQFNVQINDDTAVDYAELTITVTPEPATLSLLALGGLAMIRRRRGW